MGYQLEVGLQKSFNYLLNTPSLKPLTQAAIFHFSLHQLFI